MEIQVGEYVRTKEGAIFRAKDNIVINENMPKKIKELNDTIKNHSFKPIELIEESDIIEYRINKLSATKIGKVRKYKDARSFEEYLGVEGFSLKQIEILAIITKEQFESVEYRLDVN